MQNYLISSITTLKFVCKHITKILVPPFLLFRQLFAGRSWRSTATPGLLWTSTSPRGLSHADWLKSMKTILEMTSELVNNVQRSNNAPICVNIFNCFKQGGGAEFQSFEDETFYFTLGCEKVEHSFSVNFASKFDKNLLFREDEEFFNCTLDLLGRYTYSS